jgi:hypothetical protein
MGILGFASVDVSAMAQEDERVAEEFDARHAEIMQVAAAGAGGGRPAAA